MWGQPPRLSKRAQRAPSKLNQSTMIFSLRSVSALRYAPRTTGGFSPQGSQPNHSYFCPHSPNPRRVFLSRLHASL